MIPGCTAGVTIVKAFIRGRWMPMRLLGREGLLAVGQSIGDQMTPIKFRGQPARMRRQFTEMIHQGRVHRMDVQRFRDFMGFK